MRRIPFAVLLSLSAVALACGGGGGDSSTGGVVNPSGPPLTASFAPEVTYPGSLTVSMAERSASGDQVTVDVDVTGVTGVYGASLEISFDSGHVDFVGHYPGTFLEQGGYTVSYLARQPSAGRLVFGIQRTGPVPGADSTGTLPLIRLNFRAKSQGSFPVAFLSASALLDTQVHVIPNVTWHGGAVEAI